MAITYGGDLAILLKIPIQASCAYSLRKIGAYSGSLIKVRRSSDNTEQDIGILNGSLDETSLLNFCGSGDGFVSVWYDQSGNARNATQTTTSTQPIIVSSGVIEKKNNRPAIKFTGTQLLSSPTIAFGTTFTVFQRSTTNQVISELVGAANNRGLIAGSSGNSTYWTHDQYAVNGGSLSANQPNAAVGSTLFQVTGAGLKETSRSHQIGFGSPSWESLIGYLPELIIYPTDISSLRRGIEINQMRYYGI
jgi:hypothetical protein